MPLFRILSRLEEITTEIYTVVAEDEDEAIQRHLRHESEYQDTEYETDGIKLIVEEINNE